MARRRELKSIASGIACYCVSRNNDIDGYWALGMFYGIAKGNGSDVLTIDIMADDPVCSQLSAFRRCFRDRFESIGHRLDQFVTGYIVDFRFVPYATSQHRGQKARVTCTVHIVDDLGRHRSAFAGTFCYIHDPRYEHKSARSG